MSVDRRVSTRSRMRATLGRRDAKAGVVDIMGYMRERQVVKDPMLWPPRPALTIIGVKNALERLRSDFEIIDELTGHSTYDLIPIVSRPTWYRKVSSSLLINIQVDQALAELHALRLCCPPTFRRQGLGVDLVSAFLALNKLSAFDAWDDITVPDVRFSCLQARDAIALRRGNVQFERRANMPCDKDGNCRVQIAADIMDRVLHH